MNIAIVDRSTIPVNLYGGTQRVIWYLGKELTKLGHTITYLVNEGSYSEFATVQIINQTKPIIKQIPKNIDIVHFNFTPDYINQLETPYLITMHGNANNDFKFDKNTVFLSQNHAERYNSNSFVYNGLDWNDYTPPNFNVDKASFHFLGKASWGVKNLKGAIDIIHKTKSEHLNVLGGKRFSNRVLKMGPTYSFSPRVRFKGVVGGIQKESFLNKSKGLIFPVLWHEPFGLAIIESLFYGCPVFGTTHGSLSEIVKDEFGYLSNQKDELVRSIENSSKFSSKKCHEYAIDKFNSKTMAMNYLKKYEEIINGKKLNEINPQLKSIQKKKYLEFS